MPPRHRITATGRARRSVTPDVATWSAATEARGQTQREAFATCSEQLAALTTATKDAARKTAGVTISASGVYVHPEWDDRGRKRTGYIAGGSVTIRAGLEDAARLGQAALDAGAIRLDGPSFEVREPDLIRDEMLALAVTNARVTAERMAAADGRTVGRAIAIVDGSPDAGSAVMAPRMMARSMQMDSAAAAPPLEPGEEMLEAMVSVTFELAGQ